MAGPRILVVGGVAGGMSAAVRARRLDETAEVHVFERGPYVSFANCGLPYHVGGEIREREALVVQTPEAIRARFQVDVRTRHEVVEVDRAARELVVRDLSGGQLAREGYDGLILATGSRAVRPSIPGIDRAGHFGLRTIPDMEALEAWLADPAVRRAVVVGGGFIGLETAEQLRRRGLEVAVVEAAPQVMAPLDPEMAAQLHVHLRQHGVDLHLGDGVAGFDEDAGARASRVRLASGAEVPADVVVLALGVSPEVSLARAAGLELGELGGIRVDDRLRTSDPRILAIGDAIEVRSPVTGDWARVPLAGPANRQGRIAAANVLGGDERYAGTLGTSILRVFELTAGATGANRAALDRAGRAHQVVHVHRTSHASYYPGAETIHLELLFDPASGLLLGAQAVGRDGVDKRIDVLATALRAGMTVAEIAELELAYSPPFGNAKDPVNVAGMAARNAVDGLVRLADYRRGLDPGGALLVDVRSPGEFAAGALPGARNLPVDELRGRLGELPRDRPLLVYCRSGQRSYYAARILEQEGFQVESLDGGLLTLEAICEGTDQAVGG